MSRFVEERMTVSSGNAEALRLETAVNAFLGRFESVPVALVHVAPQAGEWSVGELAAHSAE